MCVTCDCGKVHDNHNDNRNLTLEQFQAAAEAAGKSVDEMLPSMNKWLKQGVGAGEGRK